MFFKNYHLLKIILLPSPNSAAKFKVLFSALILYSATYLKIEIAIEESMSDQIVDYLFSRIENGTKEGTMDQIIYIFDVELLQNLDRVFFSYQNCLNGTFP